MEQWHYIKTKEDINLLLYGNGYFHDSWITEVHYESGMLPNNKGEIPWDDASVRKATIVFQRDRNWPPSSVMLEFSGVMEFHINGWTDDDWIGEESLFIFNGNRIIWADVEGLEEEIKNIEDMEGARYNYIIADSLRWRVVEPKFRP